MKEYIEREALLENQQEICYWNGLEDRYDDFVPVQIIEKAPAADVAPVRHGEWKLPTINGKPLLITNFTCSVCGEFSHEETNYCPNCGARMDGDIRRKIGFYKDPKNYNISQRLTDGGK